MDTLSLRRRALAALAPLVLALSLLAGCANPFTPATPEVPNANGVVEDFSTPDRLLNTMALGIMNRGVSGRAAYLDALADSTNTTTPAFYAFHYPAVTDAWAVSAGHQPPEWTLDFEKRFYDYLIAVFPNFSYTFVWGPDGTSPSDQIDLSAGTALLHRYYVLQGLSTDQKIDKIISVGYADLYLQKLNGRWLLYRWEDRVDPSVGINPVDTDSRSMGWRRLDSLAGH